MQYFKIKEKQWMVEDISLNTIANEVATPCYVYSKSAIENNWLSFDNAFAKYPHQVNFAVKANSNLAVLNILAQLGSGFDIVSGGELARVIKAGGDPKKIIFSGVGKSKAELSQAIHLGIGCINVESEAELLRLNEIALNLQKTAVIAFRVNPDVDPKSHPYISTGREENKFGVSLVAAKALYLKASKMPGISIAGIAFHIGSQITHLNPFIEAIDKVLELINQLKVLGIPLKHIDVGGGLGVCYKDETPPTPSDYIATLISKLKTTGLCIHIEPGRAIAATAGILLTRVEYIKQQGNQNKYFAIVDAAMNDLLRPALYQAWHNITPVNLNDNSSLNTPNQIYDIVGPICETGDFLGKDRMLSLKQDDLLMIHTAGAYGFSLSSNYNTRPRIAEVMVNGNTYQIVRSRETIADLLANESLLAT